MCRISRFICRNATETIMECTTRPTSPDTWIQDSQWNRHKQLTSYPSRHHSPNVKQVFWTSVKQIAQDLEAAETKATQTQARGTNSMFSESWLYNYDTTEQNTDNANISRGVLCDILLFWYM